MEITIRRIVKCIVLDCSGFLTFGPATEALHKAIREALRDDTSKIVLNLKDVPYIDSGGITEIIGGYVHSCNHGVKLILLNLSKKIQTLFKVCGLTKVLKICDDEQKALEGCE